MAVTPLKLAIVHAEISTRDLAKKIGKHETQVSRWANGISIPRAEVATAIARELDTTVEALWPSTDATEAAA